MSSTPDFPAFEPEPSPDEPDIPSVAEMANDHPSAVAIAMDGAPSELIERVGFSALLNEANARTDAAVKEAEEQTAKISEAFLCCITQEVMTDPVV